MVNVSDFQAPFFNLSQRGTTAQPLLVPTIVVAWDPRNKGEPPLSGPQLQHLVFGPRPSVADWFAEVSQGRLRLVPHPSVPVVGPLLSKEDWQFYWRVGPWNPQSLVVGDPHRWVDMNGVYGDKGRVWYLDDDGFIGGHSHSWFEMLTAAAAHPDIELAAYDTNHNGTLEPTECLFLLVKGQARTDGYHRPVKGREVPPPAADLRLDGVTLTLISEFYSAPPHGTDELAVAAEELLHMAGNLADQYPDVMQGYPKGKNRRVDDPGRPGQLSLPDAGWRPVHVDPYHKLKWGWLNPQIAHASGHFMLRDAATTGDALILYNPHIATEEFFILENRWRGSSYDQYRDVAYGEGLAIWHCVQDLALGQDWARRAVHLRRADPRLDDAGNLQPALTLFDGSVPGRGYDLHDDSRPNDLRFRGKAPSRLQVRNISAAGPVMTVDVVVPPQPGQLGAAEGRISRLRVHARGTGYGPPGRRLPQDCVLGLDSEPGATFGLDLAAPGVGRRMFALARDAMRRNQPVRLEYRSDTPDGGQVLRISEAV
jgi:M6 family metalloprotease-like protein